MKNESYGGLGEELALIKGLLSLAISKLVSIDNCSSSFFLSVYSHSVVIPSYDGC